MTFRLLHSKPTLSFRSLIKTSAIQFYKPEYIVFILSENSTQSNPPHGKQTDMDTEFIPMLSEPHSAY